MYLPQRVDRTIKRVGAMIHLEVIVQCNGMLRTTMHGYLPQPKMNDEWSHLDHQMMLWMSMLMFVYHSSLWKNTCVIKNI